MADQPAQLPDFTTWTEDALRARLGALRGAAETVNRRVVGTGLMGIARAVLGEPPTADQFAAALVREGMPGGTVHRERRAIERELVRRGKTP